MDLSKGESHSAAAPRADVGARFVKYFTVGVVAFSIDVIVFQAMLTVGGASPYVARVVSFIAATTSAWWLNRTFTFHDAVGTRPELQWARFVAANLVGGSVNYAAFVLTIAMVPLAAAYPVIALAVGSVCGLAFNFTAYQRYVFRADTAPSSSV